MKKIRERKFNRASFDCHPYMLFIPMRRYARKWKIKLHDKSRVVTADYLELQFFSLRLRTILEFRERE